VLDGVVHSIGDAQGYSDINFITRIHCPRAGR